ncbi:MAG: hypothetical protein QM811_21545 [Pirellulales bacterium]
MNRGVNSYRRLTEMGWISGHMPIGDRLTNGRIWEVMAVRGAHKILVRSACCDEAWEMAAATADSIAARRTDGSPCEIVEVVEHPPITVAS